jgi:hypothetical protein
LWRICKPQRSRPKRWIERWNSGSRERTAELLKSAEQLRAEVAQREEMEEEPLRVGKLESLEVLAGGITHDFNKGQRAPVLSRP